MTRSGRTGNGRRGRHLHNMAPMPEKNDKQTEPAAATKASEPELVEEDLLVEEISIDGMCGVY